MLQVHKNEISLRRQSGGTAQLRTLEGTSVHILHHQMGVKGAFKKWRWGKKQISKILMTEYAKRALVTTDVAVLQYKILSKTVWFCDHFLLWILAVLLWDQPDLLTVCGCTKTDCGSVLLVKFVCQVVLQPSKVRKWPHCCSIDTGTVKSGPSPGFHSRGGQNHKGATFLNTILDVGSNRGSKHEMGCTHFKWGSGTTPHHAGDGPVWSTVVQYSYKFP